MKLMYAKLSPFTRKVVVAIAEKNLTSKVEFVPTEVGHGKINPDLMRLNPIGKIPTLVTDEGESLFDSSVIIDYLDELQPQPRLIPPPGAARRRTLRLNAVGDGLLIAGILYKVELSRPAERQWPEMLKQQWAKVVKCLEFLDAELGAHGTDVTMGEIAAGCALGWLDLRAPEEKWHEKHPGLAQWFARFGERPSMAGSRPA
jgi:glutathione S-transferase